MAPNHKFPELSSVGSDSLFEKNHSSKNGMFWRWFLAGTLLNLCMIAVVVGLSVFYVRTELQSVRERMITHEERLAWLEDAPAKQDSVKMNVPTWKNTLMRMRRETPMSSDQTTEHNATFLTRPDTLGYGPRTSGYCSCRDGRDGRDGKNGRDGAQGPPGAAGPVGAKGDKGDVGIDEDRELSGVVGHRRMKRELGDGDSSLTAENRESRSHDVYPSPKPSGGETYVRWGRTTCPNGTNTELVYAGTASGALSSHKGGTVDFFCLPSDPDWADSYNDALNTNSFLYGMEYEISFDPFSHENAEFLHNHDVPCAVCRLIDRGTQVLFPAKLGCPDNWTEEYRGFLMSGHHGHEQRSKAVCVDQAPEAIPGSKASQIGALLYIIEGRCGSLLCPPFVEGREITCTICSI